MEVDGGVVPGIAADPAFAVLPLFVRGTTKPSVFFVSGGFFGQWSEISVVLERTCAALCPGAATEHFVIFDVLLIVA